MQVLRYCPMKRYRGRRRVVARWNVVESGGALLPDVVEGTVRRLSARLRQVNATWRVRGKGRGSYRGSGVPLGRLECAKTTQMGRRSKGRLGSKVGATGVVAREAFEQREENRGTQSATKSEGCEQIGTSVDRQGWLLD